MRKLAIVTTHPIQYYAPYFKLLAERARLNIKVFYTWGEDVLKDKYDPGFKRVVKWDIPLLDGYEYLFVENVASDKGSHHFGGIKNPTIVADISGWEPDAIMVIGWSYRSHLAVLRHFHNKIPVLFRGDSTLLDEKPGFSIRKLLRTIFLHWVYRHVDYALYVGENNRKYYRKFGLRDQQLVYAPHAIDNDRFLDRENVYTSQAKDWRAGLGIAPGSVVFLFVGKFEPKKNPLLLLEVFMRLNADNAYLIFVGNGVLEDELKELASRSSNIRFIDFQNQAAMPVVYRLGDVFVLPSAGPGETWGLAINEAMACGRAVIASDKCGGAADLVENGANGYVFQSNNSGQLYTAMSGFIADADLSKQMGRKSAERVRKFCFLNIAAAIENLVS